MRPERRLRLLPRVGAAMLLVIVFASLAVPAHRQIRSAGHTTFLAGTGGLAGGRSAGQWLNRNVPTGATILAIGPSMANVLQFYGHRKVYALSVSPNAMARNPSYVPVPNPDLAIREGVFQYVVWDSFSASRTPFFTANALRLVHKYHGVAEFTATHEVAMPSGPATVLPIVVIFKVRAV
jgi:hypothetical protein